MTSTAHSSSNTAANIAALCQACVVGDVAQITTLLTTDSGIVNATDVEGFSPLLLATSYNMTAAVSALISSKATVNQFDLSGKCSPLFLAAQCGHVEITQMLLKARASPNTALDHVSPLILACKKGHLEVVECLIEARGSVNFTTQDNMTALYTASREGFDDVVAILLSHGATKSMELDCDSYTPLLIAAYYGHTNVVRELINHGCRIDAADSAGCTSLHLASSGGHLNVVEEILGEETVSAARNGDFERAAALSKTLHCDLNRRQRDGATPFFLAAQEAYLDCMQLLVDCGADVRLRFICWCNDERCALKMLTKETSALMLR